MPSTHLSLQVHVVFSTRERQPWIEQGWRDRLHAYLGGAIRTLGGVPLAVGGTGDHVHLLVGLRATHRLSDVLREIKVTSSKWVHETTGVRGFSWQDGYGAFSVSPGQADEVRKYIASQEEHHRRKTFQEEYLEFLKRNGVEYDERYLW
jgi:REP element-mobilizing transposase RayT